MRVALAYDPVGQVGRFRRIYQQIRPLLVAGAPTNKYIDFEAEFLSATGVPLKNVILVACLAWAYATNSGQNHPVVNEELFFSLPLSRAEVTEALAWISVDQQTAATGIGHEEKRYGFAWTFSVLERNPMIDLGAGDYLTLSPRLLVDRVFSSLIEMDVEDHLGRKSQPWGWMKQLRGDGVQAYVEEVLRLIAPDVGAQPRVYAEEVMREVFRLGRGKKQQICDVVVDYGDAFVLVEVISRRITRASAAGHSLNDFDREIDFLMIDKARQLDATIKRLRREEATLTGGPVRAGRRFHPVVVTDDQFPMSPVMRARAQERIAEEHLLEGDDVTQLEVLSLQDVDLLEALTAAGESAAELLASKHDANLRAMSFSSYVAFERQIYVGAPQRLRTLSHEVVDPVRDSLRGQRGHAA